MQPTILAATLTIVFEGLVAFVGPDAGGEKNKTHAALMDAQHHTPEITFTEKPGGRQTITLKDGDRITFSLGSGTAKTDPIFDARVPTLSDYIQKGKVDQNVKDQDPQNAVSVYVDLPDGTLTATGSLEHAAKFTKKDKSTEVRCPAKFVRLTAAAGDTVTLRIDGRPPKRPLTRTIDATQEVEITNATQHPGNHFNEFARLLETGGVLGFANEVTNQDCTEEGRVMTVAETKEARRNQLHPLSPNGDCSATDIP